MKLIRLISPVKGLLTLLGLVVLVALLYQPLSLAQSESSVDLDLMAQANQLYEAGQFAEAAGIYQSLVDAGLEDGALFYNLGNAYFKQEDWGRAILNYRRAQLLMPRDPDVWANLTLARAQTVDQIEIDSQVILSQVLKVPEKWLSLNEMAIALLGLWVMSILLIILLTRFEAEAWKQRTLYLLIIVTILLLGGLVSLGWRLYTANARPDGVIVANEIDVTSGPGAQYIAEFKLHSGTEVSILEERPNWTRVTLPGGQLQGWIPLSAVEPISGI